MSNENNNPGGTNSPRKEAIPISGRELVEIMVASLAEKLLANQFLGECIAYPGAKVEFLARITPMPVEEGRKIEWQDSWTLDFSNPPDVVRILHGLPVWEQLKVSLDRYVQVVEVKVPAGEELKKAAQQVASTQGGPKLPVGGKK